MKELGFLLFFLFSAYCFCFTQPDNKEDIVISILTCAPGHELYSIYGHNAIRINDHNARTDVVYNYGTFDFDTPGFALKFMRGKLPYLLSTSSYSNFLREYEYYKRDVEEQILNIDSTQKQKIINFLDNNMLPENRAYKYDFFKDNCATRLRDIVTLNAHNVHWDSSKSSDKSFRQIIKEYQKDMPWTNFGIDLIIGCPADKTTTLGDEAFIPDYLSEAIKYAQIIDKPIRSLAKNKTYVLKFDKTEKKNNPLVTPWFLFIVLLLVEINFLFRFFSGKLLSWIIWYDMAWTVLISLSSILMLFMWFGTDHIPTKCNYNLLWCSPLIVIFWWMPSTKYKPLKNWLFLILFVLLFISFVNAIPGLNFLAQYFHPIVMIISIILFLKIYRWHKTAES